MFCVVNLSEKFSPEPGFEPGSPALLAFALPIAARLNNLPQCGVNIKKVTIEVMPT